jgi:hypothetical protein
MGLDMYLYLRLPGALPPDLTRHEDGTYISGWAHRSPDERALFATLVEVLGVGEIVERGSPHLTVERNGDVDVCVAYWRKANAIHGWFVDNCQDGVDECQPSKPIQIEQLAGLVSRCERVLADHDLALELLPPRPGFFFGDTEVDSWYLEYLTYTVEHLGSVVKAVQRARPRLSTTFIYQSSW